MRMYHYSYPVRLTEEQRRWLKTMVHTSSTPAKHYLVARVLLMSDQREGLRSAADGQIAEALQINRRTVIRIKKRFVQENMEVALTGSFPLAVKKADEKTFSRPLCQREKEMRKRSCVSSDALLDLFYLIHHAPHSSVAG